MSGWRDEAWMRDEKMDKELKRLPEESGDPPEIGGCQRDPG